MASRTTKRTTPEPNVTGVYSGPPLRCSYTRLENPAALKPNPNKHPEAQLDLLGKVIGHQGWRRAPVVSRQSGLIVTGYGSVLAALKVGWKLVPIDEQDFASPEDEKAHMLADNRLPELAELDPAAVAALAAELEGKIDLDLTGFDAAALEGISKQFDIAEAAAPELAQGDRAPFQQMTFTLADQQAEIVKAAIDAAIEEGHGKSAVNENSNGNALAAVCGAFLAQ